MSLLLISGGSALAQEGAPAAPPASAPASTPEASPGSPDGSIDRSSIPWQWTLQIEPTLWYSALGGDVTIGGGTEASAETLDIDDPQASPAGELHFRRDKLTFTFFGASLSNDESANARAAFTAGNINVAQGDPIDTEVDYMNFHAVAGWNVGSWPPKEPREGWKGPVFDDSKVQLRLDVYGGARVQYMEAEVRSGGASAGGEGWFAQPVIGARAEMELTRHFSIDLCLDGGWWPGDSGGSTSVSVMVGFQWRPWDHVGFQIGFRQMFFNLEDEGEIEYDGSIGGLMGAVVLRF